MNTVRKAGLSTGWQFFLAIAGVGLLLVLVVLLGIRLFFAYNFTQYLAAQEEQRLQELASLVADYYEVQLQQDPEFTLGQLGDLRSAEFRRLLAGLTSGHFRETRDTRQRREASRPRTPGRFPLRAFTMYDANNNLIIGRPADNPIRVDIRLGNERIGTLETERPDGPLQPIDDVFQQQQLSATVVAGALAVLLAGIAAALLAQRLRQRLQHVTQATRSLALGNYQARVPVSGNDDLSALAQDFNSLAAALEASSRQRRDFMADIAHELRTPLTILQGELEAVEDGIRKPDPAHTVLLQSQVRQLTRLVYDLHTLAEADAGSLSYAWQPVELVNWLGSQRETLLHQAEKQGLQANIELPDTAIHIQSDPVRLAQLLHNVWQNSLVYTEVPGEVRLMLSQREGYALVCVEDSAPGVPEQALSRLFERLYRVESSRNRAGGGSGLGLALVERIVHAHQGKVNAGPSELGGLRIEAWLPLARESGVTS